MTGSPPRCRGTAPPVGLGSVSAYLLEHAEVATAVVRQGTALPPQVRGPKGRELGSAC